MMWPWGKKKHNHRPALAADADAALFAGLRRGTGATPRAMVQFHYKTAEVLARWGLKGDPRGPGGDIILGLAGGTPKEHADHRGRKSRYVTDGQFVVSNDNRHLFTAAGSRAGKSVSLIVPNLLRYAGSVLVIDPKGDLARETCHHRARALGQRVFVLDPFGVSGPKTLPYRATFNPLQGVDAINDPEVLFDIAAMLADALVVRSASVSDPHWDDASRAFVETTILHVMTAQQYRGRRTLATVWRILMEKATYAGPDGLPVLAGEMLDNPAVEGLVAAGARAHYERHSKEADSVMSSVRRHLHFLGSPQIARAVEDGPANLAASLTEPTTIYACLPATKMGACAGWLRMFVNLLMVALEQNPERHKFQTGEAERPPLLMILDEFPVLGYMKRLEDAVGQMAGMGCKLWPIVQDLGQLKAIFGDRWESFLGNAGVMTFWGNMDLFTLDYIERRLGMTQVVTSSQSHTTLDASIEGGASGTSFSLSQQPFMSVPEIAATFGREDPQLRMLVLTSTGPVIVQRCSYFAHPVLKEMHVHE